MLCREVEHFFFRRLVIREERNKSHPTQPREIFIGKSGYQQNACQHDQGDFREMPQECLRHLKRNMGFQRFPFSPTVSEIIKSREAGERQALSLQAW